MPNVFMINQFLQIFLQFLSPLLNKLPRLHIQISQKILMWQFRHDVTPIILYNLVVQKLEIVKSSADDCVESFVTYFSCLYFVQFVAGQITLLYQLRLVYDNFLSFQTLLFLSFSQIKSLRYPHPLRILFIIFDRRPTDFLPTIKLMSLAISDRCCSSRLSEQLRWFVFHYFLLFIAIQSIIMSKKNQIELPIIDITQSISNHRPEFPINNFRHLHKKANTIFFSEAMAVFRNAF